MKKGNPKPSDLYKNLRREIGKIQLIDAHEHLLKEKLWITLNDGLFSILGYVITDLISAGMKIDDLNSFLTLNIEERWRLIKPFWPYVKNMGAGILCRKALSMYCDVEDLDESLIPHILDELCKYMKPGIYQDLFKKHKIGTVINVVEFYDIYSTNELKPILNTSKFATVQNRSDISQIEKVSGQQIYSLKTYLHALDVILENGAKDGLVGIKWHKLAYLRDIEYPIQDEFSAEKCLDRIFRMPARFIEIGEDGNET